MVYCVEKLCLVGRWKNISFWLKLENKISVDGVAAETRDIIVTRFTRPS